VHLYIASCTSPAWPGALTQLAKAPVSRKWAQAGCLTSSHFSYGPLPFAARGHLLGLLRPRSCFLGPAQRGKGAKADLSQQALCLLVFPIAPCLRGQSHPLWGHPRKSLSTGDGFSRGGGVGGSHLATQEAEKRRFCLFTHSGIWSGRGWQRLGPSAGGTVLRKGGTQACAPCACRSMLIPCQWKEETGLEAEGQDMKVASMLPQCPGSSPIPTPYSLVQAFAVCLLCTRYYAVEVKRTVPRGWRHGSTGKGACCLISGTRMVYGEDWLLEVVTLACGPPYRHLSTPTPTPNPQISKLIKMKSKRKSLPPENCHSAGMMAQ
jgi:hypothetical protein